MLFSTVPVLLASPGSSPWEPLGTCAHAALATGELAGEDWTQLGGSVSLSWDVRQGQRTLIDTLMLAHTHVAGTGFSLTVQRARENAHYDKASCKFDVF